MPPRPPSSVSWIRCDGEDAFVRVHAQPGAATAGVGAVDPWRGALAVRVKAAPRGGDANAEIAEVLARALGVARSAVEIVRGSKARDKEIRVRGCTCGRAREILGGGR